jgi:hypothetical protein
LLRRDAKEEARLGVGRVKGERAIERLLRFRGHDPVCRIDNSFAEISLALRIDTADPQHVAAGLHRVVETAKPGIDRRQHLPAARILRVFFKMRFDARNQFDDRR